MKFVVHVISERELTKRASFVFPQSVPETENYNQTCLLYEGRTVYR